MASSAAAYADSAVAAVRDDPRRRLALLRSMYDVPVGVDRGYLPFGRAASSFMDWQLRRGLLNPENDARPGSPWWRALNEALLRDTAEARALAFGQDGVSRRRGVRTHLDFIEHPTARNWYRAHNVSIVESYLAKEELATRESRVERFFLNVVLIRVLYAHALVAAPRLALGWLAPLARPIGDPRVGMTGIFLSLSRILPDAYPLGDDVENYVAVEHTLGQFIDIGFIWPRLASLYDWSADELEIPGLRGLLHGVTPTYAWDAGDDRVWRFAPSRLARIAHRVVPAR